MIYLAEGYSEAYGTGVMAAYAVLQLYPSNKKGVRRLEEFTSFEEVIRYLKTHQIKIKTRKK